MREVVSKDRFWIRIIYIVSVILLAAIAFLILGPRPRNVAGSLDVSMLPTVNALLNSTTAVLLILGFAMIRRKRVPHHRTLMLSAFATSTLFLTTYVIYHWFKSGPKPYLGEWKGIYLLILLTHIVLAALILPMALITLYRGWTLQVDRHRWIARITLPAWLYVSITGVLIYWMLYG